VVVGGSNSGAGACGRQPGLVSSWDEPGVGDRRLLALGHGAAELLRGDVFVRVRLDT